MWGTLKNMFAASIFLWIYCKSAFCSIYLYIAVLKDLSIIIFAFEIFDLLMYSLTLKSHALNILKVFLSVCTNACTGQSCRVTSVVKTSLHKYFWSGCFQQFIAVSPPILPKELQAPSMLRAAAFSANCITSTHQAKELGMSVLLHTITSSLPISVLTSNV